MQKSCIVIPCYNEGNRFPLAEFDSFYSGQSTISFCLVDDNSVDNTLELLQSFERGRKERVHVIKLASNQGKAEAVRQGVLAALQWQNFDLVGYFDADLATPLSEIAHLLAQFDKLPKCQMAFGSRVKRLGANIERNPYRHYSGRIFSTMTSLILKLPVYDTQCGAKLLRVGLAKQVFDRPFLSRWLFDIEIFARINQLYRREKVSQILIEVPLNEWIEKGDSRIELVHILKVPIELFRIYQKYR